MNKISVAFKGDKNITKNGFHFIAKDDGYVYCDIHPRQWHYVNMIIKDIEKKEYKKVVKRRRRTTVKED